MKLHSLFVSMPAIHTLVREILSCNCPVTVFDDVRVGIPSLFGTHKVDGGLEILAGQRLLITLVPLAGLADPAAEVPSLLETGRAARDAHGFNRFRLVVAGSPDPAMRRSLEEVAGRLEERVHLHVIEIGKLEKLFNAA